MNLKKFDDKCVRITTVSGEVYEGIVSFCSSEYVFQEYGQNQEALHLVPVLFCEDEIANVVSLEDVNGPFGHFSESYGLLERKCLDWGTDLIGEVFDTDDDIQIHRMLVCMNDNFQSLADRMLPGMAPWRCENNAWQPKEEDDEQGTVYLGELEKMLDALIKSNESDEVVKEAEKLRERLAEIC